MTAPVSQKNRRAIFAAMKLHFYIRYRTRPGEALFITGNCPALGSGDSRKALKINYLNEKFWHGAVEIAAAELPDELQYHYLFQDKNGEFHEEWETERTFGLADFKPTKRSVGLKNQPEIISFVDAWNSPAAVENAFATQPFQQVFLKNEAVSVAKPVENPTHFFRIKAPVLGRNEAVCLLGDSPVLGNWEPKTPIFMQKTGNWWAVSLNLTTADFPLAYKYGIWNTSKNQFDRWETGDNRLAFDNGLASKMTVISDGFVRLEFRPFRGAGVAIPVFSLRSEKSWGAGEFTDLAALADWSKSVGLRLIQLLPINDTSATGTWTDSYPYASISAFALHPIYLNLEAVAGSKFAAVLKPFLKQKADLNAAEAVDYERVMSLKWEIMRLLFPKMKAAFLADKTWQNWFSENTHWLKSYAAFCFLKTKNGTAEFTKWTTNSTFSADEIDQLTSPDSPDFDEIAVHYFVQFHLHLQLKAATDYAHSLGLAVKGDIPIGIYRHSADAWTAPDLYEMNAQAGAPPDDFAEKGQNWGFPTYNWEAMKADNFAWWRQRFGQMSHYFDAFRIDHILGFFRIWSIPLDAIEGILGRFVPAIPLKINELYEAGIPINRDRLCRPFITNEVLNGIFGHDAEFIRAACLDPRGDGRFDLKTEFSTQRLVDAFFKKQEKSERNDRLRQGLFDLISNVILYDEGDGEHFHFRFGIDKTSSFQNLEPAIQNRLNSLYVNYFWNRQDEFWARQAMEKLPALKRSTPMLICGEDLGMVPACVPGVMEELGILSLEIQRMPKATGTTFFHPKDAPYLSVVTPSTHDMSTIRGWWEENQGLSQQFFREILGQSGQAPFYAEPWVCRFIVAQHLNSPAMWSIFQLQDLMSIDGRLRRELPDDERINQPANPTHYWRYRMHFSLERLQKEADFNDSLRQMVAESGRE